MERKRVQVYADPETKRRIELAAAKRNMAVTEYCLTAIRQQLAEDDVLEENRIEIQIRATEDADVVTALRALRERIKTRRGGKLIDVDAALDQTRADREHELIHLR